ncbi:hypothetical protein DRV85_02800 [Rhodosalinus halophilus]|uniref:D-galactarate dehydratase n=1 Tax=Rhodosalinus halophilus TaxID=2259333 RepID=A0A365UCM1_9RHOB|nr:hypothetical protein [Rhodosalinus halophilus]RBI87071.1 hypothetical protein DRV85_02800 [Rhodosalinus halophilus]
MRVISVLLLALVTAACAAQIERPQAPTGDGQTRPLARPAQDATAQERTADTLGTTTPAGRPAAAGAGGGVSLGTTVASLGDPTEAGFWLKTPLVAATSPGRVEYAGTGQAVEVELRPSGTEAGGGSQISLAAMRALGAPLTGLPELRVYRR